MLNRLVVLVLVSGAAACGPTFSFQPSNLPATFDFAATDDMIFGVGGCGPRAELDTNTGEVRCFESGGGGYAVPFRAITSTVTQSDSTSLMVFAGRSVRINAGAEVQLRGDRPAVLLSLGNMLVGGRITAENPILQYGGEGGGFSEPAGNGPDQGLGPGGGFAVSGAGAGGASYCGRGGKGGDDTGTGTTGALGGVTYGTPDLMPLSGGASGGLQGNHSGAGGGAIHLVASGSIDITPDAIINMGGLGGGWFGNGGGSGGAVLIEGDSVSVQGKISVNGGGGGGGSGAGAGDGQNAGIGVNVALGGVAGAAGSAGGAGSAGDGINGGNAGSVDGQPGGGGGGSGRIRINTRSGDAPGGGQLSPSTATPCASVGRVAPRG